MLFSLLSGTRQFWGEKTTVLLPYNSVLLAFAALFSEIIEKDVGTPAPVLRSTSFRELLQSTEVFPMDAKNQYTMMV